MRLSSLLRILFVSLVLFGAQTYAFNASARVSKTSTAVAESLTIRIDLSDIPQNATLVGPWGGVGWENPIVLLQSFPMQSKGSDATWTGVFAVIDTGNYRVPAFDIYAIRGSDTTKCKTTSIPISIHSTLKSQNGQGIDTLLKPDKPVKKIPPSVWEWLFWIGTPIFLAALVYGIIKYRAYRKSLLPPPPPPPPPSPEKVAFARLSEIRAEAKWQLGELKDFQTDLVDCLKVYIDNRFGYDAREKTTSDLREREVITILGENEHRLFIALLSIADEVKFARGEIAANRCQEAVKEGEQLVGTWGIRWQQTQDALQAALDKERAAHKAKVVIAVPPTHSVPMEPSLITLPEVEPPTQTTPKRTLLDDIRDSKEGGETQP